MNPRLPRHWHTLNLWALTWAMAVWTFLLHLQRCLLKTVHRSSSQAAIFAVAAFRDWRRLTYLTSGGSRLLGKDTLRSALINRLTPPSDSDEGHLPWCSESRKD